MKRDLRNLNEEEFKKVYNYLKKKTANFTIFPPTLLLENNQFLLIIRICLGLSQKEFGKSLNRTKDWCRHTEAKRNVIINISIANRYANQIENLLKRSDIKLQIALKTWKEYAFSRENDFKIKKPIAKPYSKMNNNELKSLFNYVNKSTKNFTVFDPNILINCPKSILIFRLALGLDRESLLHNLDVGERSLRRYECGEGRIKKYTAYKSINAIRKIFLENNLIGSVKFEKVLESFRIMTNFYGNRNLESMMKRGLYELARLNKSNFERKLELEMKKQDIKFEFSGVVKGVKRNYAVDFAIPNAESPILIIEAFEYTVGGKSRNVKTKVRLIDHHFQMLKLRNPDLVTVMIINLIGRPILKNFVRKCLEMEILNTDHIFINENLQKVLLELKKLF